MVLRRFKDGETESDCLCRQLIALKEDRLHRAYSQAVEQLRKAKPESRNHQRTLGHVLKLGNKLRAVREIIGEIAAVDSTLENMIEIEINGRIFSRLNLKTDYQRSCKGKVRYSLRSAPEAAIEMTEKTGEQMDWYKCRHCDHWHVGHSVQ